MIPDRREAPAAARVAIIIAVTRGGERLHACLASLQEHLPAHPSTEILLVAHAACPVPGDAPRQTVPVRVIRTEVQLSVSSACNLASSRSSAEYLALLDEHAVIEAGWLEWLLHTLDAHPAVAAVGSFLFSPDGPLQEAGLVVWRDGSVSGVGRGMPADTLAWRFVRRVDCVSSRALLLRRAMWNRAGGFDDTLAAGVCRDVDLCLRLRRLGAKVLVEPRSHAGVPEHAAASDFEEFLEQRCREELVRRWHSELFTNEHPLSGSIYRAVHRARGYPRRVLIVDDFVPDPAAGAGFGRMFDAIVELARDGWAVSHFPTRGLAAPGDPLIDSGVSIVDRPVGPHLQDPETWYDVVLVSRPHNFDFVWPMLRVDQPWARLVCDMEAAWWRRIARQADLAVDPERARQLHADAAAMRAMEDRNARAADMVVAISEEENAGVRNAGIPANAVHTVLPFGLSARVTERAFCQRSDVGFVAGWMAGADSPNGDGLLWFISEVLPLIRRSVPSITVRVTGNNPPRELIAFSDASLHFEGHVADLHEFYDRIRVVIVPMRFGSGVKLKTVEAVQHAVPTVSTSIGAEGLVLEGGDGVHVVEDAAAFAAEVVRLLTDEHLWQRSRDALLAQIDAWTSARAHGGTWPDVLDHAYRTRRHV